MEEGVEGMEALEQNAVHLTVSDFKTHLFWNAGVSYRGVISQLGMLNCTIHLQRIQPIMIH